MARAVAPASLEDRRAERKSHRWTKWQREVKKLPWLPRSKTLRQLIDELVFRADNETGEWRLFLAELAEAMGASERTVQRRMGDLKELGLIEYEPGRSNPKTRSWFRLIPLGTGATECHPRADTVSAREDGQVGASGATPGHSTGATESALTAVRTTQATEPPQPPRGGRAQARRVRAFPPRPAGQRRRDLDAWLEQVREWASSERLPVEEHWEQIEAAAQDCRPDRAAFVDWLERWTDWRDHPGATESPAPPSLERECAQLELPL